MGFIYIISDVKTTSRHIKLHFKLFLLLIGKYIYMYTGLFKLLFACVFFLNDRFYLFIYLFIVNCLSKHVQCMVSTHIHV